MALDGRILARARERYNAEKKALQQSVRAIMQVLWMQV